MTPPTQNIVELALRHSCTIYDVLYLTLAIQTEGTLVTADRKLIDNASAWLPGERTTWVGNME